MATESKESVIGLALLRLGRSKPPDISRSKEPAVLAMRDMFDETLRSVVQMRAWREFTDVIPAEQAPADVVVPEYYYEKRLFLRPPNTTKVLRITNAAAISHYDREGSLHFTEYGQYLLVDVSYVEASRSPTATPQAPTPNDVQSTLDLLNQRDGVTPPNPRPIQYYIWRSFMPSVDRIQNSALLDALKTKLAMKAARFASSNDDDFYNTLQVQFDESVADAVQFDRNYNWGLPYKVTERRDEYNYRHDNSYRDIYGSIGVGRR